MAVIIDDICLVKANACSNPIYLTWKNDLGGWDYWLFQYKQEYSLTTKSTGKFNQYNDDLSSQNSTVDFLKKTGNEIIRLGDDFLSLNEVQAIKQIFTSPKVYMFNRWIGSPQVPEWKTVIIEQGTFRLYSTDNTFHELEFEINLPDLYTLGN